MKSKEKVNGIERESTGVEQAKKIVEESVRGRSRRRQNCSEEGQQVERARDSARRNREHFNEDRREAEQPGLEHTEKSLSGFILFSETKGNEFEIYGRERKNAYYPKHSLRQHLQCVWK